LAHGHVATWDPYRFSGTPFAANSQTAFEYPPNWLFSLGHTLRVNETIQALSALGALLLAYWFFRVIKLHPYAAVAGAAIFTFSGFMLGWREHVTLFGSGMWLPGVFGGLEVAFHDRRWKGIAIAGSCLALSLLAGHAQVALYVWTAALIWTVLAAAAEFLRKDAARAAARRAAIIGLTLAGSVAVAGLLAAPQILATGEFSNRIVRSFEPYDAVVRGTFPAGQVSALLVPERFGSIVDSNYTGHSNSTEAGMYAGIISLSLGAFAVARRRDRWTLGFLILAVVGALAAWGTPVYRLFYLLPKYDQTRQPSRMIFLVDTSIAALAALGIDAFMRAERRARLWLAGSCVAAAGLALLAIEVGGIRDPLTTGYVVQRAVRAAAFALAAAIVVLIIATKRRGIAAAVIVLLIAGDLWAYGFRYHPFETTGNPYPVTPPIAAMQALTKDRSRFLTLGKDWFQRNSPLMYRMYGIGGSDTFILRNYVELIDVAQNQLKQARDLNLIGRFTKSAMSSPVLDLLGARYAVSSQPEPAVGATVFDQGPYIMERKSAFPPVFTTTCWNVASSGEALALIARATTDDLRTTAYIDDSPDARALGSPSGPCSSEPATITRYEPERVTVHTAPTKAAVLVLSDSWYPGWRARVDGNAAPILVTDHALRGVALTPGDHIVEFTYHPAWLAKGLALAILGLLALVALAVLDRRRQI
ncbi:MAG: YfhO family protein, partial [Actinobacteria bacterium]|nr:YfhO family protein [Actinomycetota bacterium]